MMHTKSTESRVPSTSQSESLPFSLCSTLLLVLKHLQGAITKILHLCSRKAGQPWGGALAR